MFTGRIRRILDNENPAFTPYTAEADPLFHDNCRLRTLEVMDDLFNTRRALSSSMASLTEGDFEKKARHTNYGTMTLSHWLHFFLPSLTPIRRNRLIMRNVILGASPHTFN